MRNNLKYIRLRDYAFDHDYTIEQIENVTHREAESLLGISIPLNFNNVKRCLIKDLQERDDTVISDAIKSKVKSWLDANYADWKAEKGRESNKPFIKIWPDGQAEVI